MARSCSAALSSTGPGPAPGRDLSRFARLVPWTSKSSPNPRSSRSRSGRPPRRDRPAAPPSPIRRARCGPRTRTGTGSPTSSGTPWPRGGSTPRALGPDRRGLPGQDGRGAGADRPRPAGRPDLPAGAGPGLRLRARRPGRRTGEPRRDLLQHHPQGPLAGEPPDERLRVLRQHRDRPDRGDLRPAPDHDQRHLDLRQRRGAGPENISLRGNGSGIFGNFEVVTLEGVDPQAPVVVINGYSVFGNVEARPKRGKWITDLQGRMRKHLGH